MRVVVGVDSAGHWRAPVALLQRLRLPDVKPILVHCVEPLPAIGMFPEAIDQAAVFTMEKGREDLGRQILAEAHQALGMGSEERLEFGTPVHTLLHAADESGAKMIAVGSEEKGSWGSMFLGSVGKGVLIGAQQSILFGKGQIPTNGPVTAILATDHSPYVDRGIDWLLDNLPRGIGKFIILSAVEDGSEDVARAEKANHDLAIRFAQHGLGAHGEVAKAHPAEAIKKAMERHNADLLILGAQGHGFLERLRVGSVSFDQVINSPHSVLVLRP